MARNTLVIICLALLLAAWSAAAAENTMDDHDMAMPVHGEMETDHSGEGNVNWYAVTLFLGFIAFLGYSSSKTEALKKINLLDFRLLKNPLRSRWYPLIFVLPTLIVFSMILISLFFGNGEASLNFGSVMVWIFLWPILPILFLLFGRLWCSVCPMSKISDEVQRRVGLNKKVPRFLQKYGVWIIIAAFLVITWSDVAFGLVESPRNTGYLLTITMVGVILIGAIFEKRAWCRYLCFLGGLSSNYSMSSALELRADKEVCKTCKTPTCYTGDNRVDGCSMFEYPRTMDSNRFCNFCSNCIKTCQHDAIRITPRLPTSELWFIKKPRLEDSFLAVALIGIVISQTVIMLEVWEPFMAWFERTTGITNFYIAWTLIFAGAMLIPAGLMLAASFVSNMISQASPHPGMIHDQTAEAVFPFSVSRNLRSDFVRYGHALIPLGLGIHLAHNAKHFLGEGLSVVYTSASLAGLSISGDLSLLNMPTIQILQYLLSILGVIGAVYTAYRISLNSHKSGAYLIPYIVLILLLGVLALWMYSVPMAARAH